MDRNTNALVMFIVTDEKVMATKFNVKMVVVLKSVVTKVGSSTKNNSRCINTIITTYERRILFLESSETASANTKSPLQ